MPDLIRFDRLTAMSIVEWPASIPQAAGLDPGVLRDDQGREKRFHQANIPLCRYSFLPPVSLVFPTFEGLFSGGQSVNYFQHEIQCQQRCPMEEQAEKRQAPRNPFQYPLLIELSDPASGAFEAVQKQVRGVDINSQGIGIITDTFIDPGQVVKTFVPVGTPETLISSFSQVRWVQGKNGNYRVGLSFIL
jgi:hypothetical protein